MEPISNSENTVENQDKMLDNFIHLIKQYKQFQANRIPMCAAENIISPFARIPLSSDIHERYIMGGLFDFDPINNFIGSSYLYPFYELVNKYCKNLFGSLYADARTLSGMNAITSLLMSITEFGDTIILSMPESGAHPSYPGICKRLGLTVIPMPYDYKRYNIDVTAINDLCQREKPTAFIVAPSDLLFPPRLEELKLPDETLIIYDATQTLGLIAGRMLPNPLKQNKRVILLGGTHKTLPGPTNGLIMTNDSDIAKQIDKSISPKFVRNTQMHQIASLILCLIEFKYFGHQYSKKMVENANILGSNLEDRDFTLAKIDNLYSSTHQIFVLLDKSEADLMFKRSLYYGISLNKKHKRLFRNHGLRLGLQEVTRYNWGIKELEMFSDLFRMIRYNNGKPGEIDMMIKELSTMRTIHFTFEDDVLSRINKELK